MKSIRHRRWLIALIVIIVGVLVGLTWLLWPQQTKSPIVRLSILKETYEPGKHFVFFKLSITGNQRFLIHKMIRIPRETISYPVLSEEPLTPRNFWEKKSPVGHPYRGSVIFGVPEPTNSVVWTLHVTVYSENRRTYKAILGQFKSLRRQGKSWSLASSEAWNTFYREINDMVNVESDAITNTPSR